MSDLTIAALNEKREKMWEETKAWLERKPADEEDDQ